MSIASGNVFEGTGKFRERDFSIRIKINSVDGPNFKTQNEIWKGNFEQKVDVSEGFGTFIDMGNGKVQMNWQDNNTKFEGIYNIANSTMTGRFFQYQEPLLGQGANFVLTLKA